MSVLVPFMNMPKTCDDCQVSCDCPHDEHIDGYMMEKPSRFCPLKELPPHGRLIDADALKDTLDYYIREAGWSDEINEALTWVRDEFIDNEHTIIEAEEVSE